MINPKAREWTFGPILKLLATLLALLVVLACVGSSGAPPASPTPPPGMFSTLPTTEPPVVGDHLPTIELKTLTPNPTYSPVLTPTPYPTATPYPTFTPQPTYTPPVPTPTPYPAATPYPTFTPQPTYTPVPTQTPYPTATPYPMSAPTFTPQPTYTPVPTQTPYPTATPYPMPAPTFTPQPTYTPVPTPTLYPTATPYPTYSPQPTYTPVPTAKPHPTNTPVPAAMSYFTRGSSQDEVLSVQGTPTEINIYSATGIEVWGYGFSRVTFSLPGGRVTEWSNTGNLKVRMVPAEFYQIDFFTRGSSQDEVLSVQGTPTEINIYSATGIEVWGYGFSRVTFSLPGGRVTEWSNTGNLKVRLVPG